MLIDQSQVGVGGLRRIILDVSRQARLDAPSVAEVTAQRAYVAVSDRCGGRHSME